MNFVALDFETANACLASICQVGIAEFKNGHLVSNFSSLVDPQDYFSGINISIHGIEETDVIGAPIFPDVYPILVERLSGRFVVTHTAFDRGALRRAVARYSLSEIDCRWLDSARVVRRTWPEYSRSGYGLSLIAASLGIEYRHHDALEDARAAGEVLVQAMNKSSIGVDGWWDKLREHHIGGSIKREGNSEGVLYGENLVFTGALSILRRDAADLAAQNGCHVTPNVTKDTTIVVVGDQDITRLASGQTRSSKHRKAEVLIKGGTMIRIIGESDFMALCRAEIKPQLSPGIIDLSTRTPPLLSA
jgi:DNA polymerase-3 subunit epsilon